ncbi:MAG TPA: hypothetical protein VGD17_04970 [Chitinophagaceae bacterium]
MFEFGANFNSLFKLYLIPALFLLTCEGGDGQSLRAVPQPFNPGCYSRKFTDAFSITGNPASLVSYEKFTAGIYSGRLYMLKELKHAILAGGFPLANSGAGFLVNHLSIPGFQQSEAAIGYAKQLGSIDIGVRFGYHRIGVPAYGSKGGITFGIGSSWHVTDDLHAGLQILNPSVGRAEENIYKTSHSYRAGLGYEVSGQVLLGGEINKEEDKPAEVSLAMQYQPVARVLLRAGIAVMTGEPNLDVGFSWNQWRLIVSMGYHVRLGASPGMYIIYKSK